jgi:hypothetical protein
MQNSTNIVCVCESLIYDGMAGHVPKSKEKEKQNMD